MTTADTLGLPRWTTVAEWFRRRATERSGRRRLAALGFVVAAAALFAGLLHTDLFAVQQINVTGNNRISREAVVEKAGVNLTMPIVSVDKGAIRKKLMGDPWVETAVVVTHWPHRVDLVITERRPLLLARTTNNKWAELGAGGVVLNVADRPTSGMPVALGVTAEPKLGASLDAQSQSLVTVSAALPESLRGQVTQLMQDQRGVRLGLASNVVVLVGSTDDLGPKLTAAATVLRSTDPKTIEVLDVTSPSLPVTTSRAKAVQATIPPKPTTTSQVPTTNTRQSTPQHKPQVSING